MLAAQLVQLLHHLKRIQRLAVQRYTVTLQEFKLQIFRFVRRVFRRVRQQEHFLVLRSAGVEPRVLQHAALIADVQQVAVHGIRLRRRSLYRNTVRFGISDHFRASREPVAELFQTPRRDNLDVRSKASSAELETYLVVALAGRTMRNGGRAFGDGDIDHPLRDQRAGDTRAEQVLSFIQGASLEHRVDEVLGELVAQVVDVDFRRACGERLFLQTVKLFLLADIGRKSDNFRVIRFFQPFQNDRGIQAAGIGEHDFFFCHGIANFLSDIKG
ncbi:hypothetical protein D3C81_734970 [compost metagenome]